MFLPQQNDKRGPRPDKFIKLLAESTKILHMRDPLPFIYRLAKLKSRLSFIYRLAKISRPTRNVHRPEHVRPTNRHHSTRETEPKRKALRGETPAKNTMLFLLRDELGGRQCEEILPSGGFRRLNVKQVPVRLRPPTCGNNLRNRVNVCCMR